jgi:hypothetical protein
VIVFLIFMPVSIMALELGGGPLFIWHMVNFDDLNTYVSSVGIDEFGNGMLLIGGYGYFAPTDNFRLGFAKAGFSKTSMKRVDTATREVSFSLSYTGLTLEYIFPSDDMHNISAGVLVGIGDTEVRIGETDQGSIDWDDVWDGFSDPGASHHTAILNSSFFAWQPFVRFKYHLHPLVALQGSIGYLGVKPSSWELGPNADVHHVPDLDFGGFHITIGPHFGL